MPSAQSRFLDRSTPPHVATLVAQSAIAALAMNVFFAVPAQHGRLFPD